MYYEKIIIFNPLNFLSNCNSRTEEQIQDDLVVNEMKGSMADKQSANAINYEIKDEQFIFQLYSDKNGSSYDSFIEVSNADSLKLFSISYSFDVSESHW